MYPPNTNKIEQAPNVLDIPNFSNFITLIRISVIFFLNTSSESLNVLDNAL